MTEVRLALLVDVNRLDVAVRRPPPLLPSLPLSLRKPIGRVFSLSCCWERRLLRLPPMMRFGRSCCGSSVLTRRVRRRPQRHGHLACHAGAPQPDKPVKPHALPATFADAVRQGLSNAPKPTPKQPPRTAGDTFARLAASGCAKPAKAGKKPSLAQAGWKCQVVTANAIRHQATGPRLVTAYTAQQLQDVLNWASASKPEHPTTCVDFVSEDTTHQVLVQLPGAPSLSLQKVKLHQLTADGPMPDGLAVKSEFDDDREFAGTSKADWKVFRLTLVREFADASRFADGCNRPQGLPGMMLSPALASKVVRTFAVRGLRD